MASAGFVHLPVFQRFDCGACTYCCREPIVAVNEQDRKRILAAGWQERMKGQDLFVHARAGRRRFWRLARKSDGSCVFLEGDRCRLHAETGAQTKPLACRLFPFVIVPGVGGVRLDLRMDCPSAAANRGRTLSVHAGDVAKLAAESGIERGSPRVPAWGAQRPLTADDFTAVVGAFDSILRKSAEPVRTRLKAGCHLLDLMYAARIEKIRDRRFAELMELLSNAALEEAKATDTIRALGNRPGRLFRQWLFLHALVDAPERLGAGPWARWRDSWRRYGQARQFAAGKGPVPKIQDHWPDTTFEEVAAVGGASEEALEPVCRALRLKLDAHAFAGPAYFGYDLLAGLTALWLLPGVVGWFARLAAVKRGGDVPNADDVLAGTHIAHQTFGVSPVFNRVSERLRMRGLARPGLPAAVLEQYGA